MTGPDPYDHARRLAAESLADNDPTGWFERLYAQAEAGEALVPGGGCPYRLLVEWARTQDVQDQGRRALVVGCGLGDDTEYIADPRLRHRRLPTVPEHERAVCSGRRAEPAA